MSNTFASPYLTKWSSKLPLFASEACSNSIARVTAIQGWRRRWQTSKLLDRVWFGIVWTGCSILQLSGEPECRLLAADRIGRPIRRNHWERTWWKMLWCRRRLYVATLHESIGTYKVWFGCITVTFCEYSHVKYQEADPDSHPNVKIEAHRSVV